MHRKKKERPRPFVFLSARLRETLKKMLISFKQKLDSETEDVSVQCQRSASRPRHAQESLSNMFQIHLKLFTDYLFYSKAKVFNLSEKLVPASLFPQELTGSGSTLERQETFLL